MRATNICTAALCFCLCAFSLSGSAAVQPAAPKVTLRVALFPYLPDAADDKFQALATRVEREFEAANPGIDLQLRPLDVNDEQFYDIDELAKWLGTSGPPEYDLVEVDTILLGELNLRVSLPAWSALPARAWHEAASLAVRVNGKNLGVPHWLCSYFVMGTDARLSTVRNISQLASTLKSSASPGSRLLAGDLQGSFTLPSYYLDAWADTYPGRDTENALKPATDSVVVGRLREFSALCSKDGQNPCLTDAKYNDDGLTAAKDVAKGTAHSLVAYSERLHHLRRAAGMVKTWTLASAPVGGGRHPAVFVDALVRSPKCIGGCERAASAFSHYITQPATVEWMVLSDDVNENRVPRYLIPAHSEAYTARVLSDPYYRQIRSQLIHARPFPRFGFYYIRADLRDRLRDQLLPK
jgi:thiamine pyridinylase